MLSETENSVENIRLNFEEHSARYFLFNASTSLFLKSSPAICEVLCTRLLSFITSTVFDPRHFSGSTMLAICHMISRTRPAIVEKVIMGRMERIVVQKCDDMRDEFATLEKIDSETLWNFALFKELVTGHKE